MWNYGAFVSDPMGCLPRNGDADLCNSGCNAVTASYFKRDDWTFVCSQGKSGTPPNMTSGPSSAFEWSGQLVMRSGFDSLATWAFFDVGPYGSSGHAHRDKLNLVLHAKGSMLLVDSGRFAYAGMDLSATLHRAYAANTTAHNTLTIDGADQLPLPAVATAPISPSSFGFAPAADWAYGSMSLYDTTVLKGTATHTRAVYYQRAPAASAAGASADGDFLLVVDALSSDRPRSVQATWRAHPNATGVAVGADGVAVVGGVATHSGQPTQAQACIMPVAGPGVPRVRAFDRASLVAGVYANATTGVRWQGWFSQSYDDAWPTPTLVYDAAAVPDGAIFAWLIVPQSARGACGAAAGSAAVLSANATAVVFSASVGGASYPSIVLPFAAP